MNHWIRPSCDSRTGASHLRRGAPCQDASGFLGFRDADGTPIQVLVVSDGHGGARYVRSDVGARLACAVAMRELQQALAPARVAPAAAQQDWRDWLAQDLPARLVDAWRREVESHWRADPAADGSGFSPLLYGATLGVLLLTPGWWAHTGLGDWDLVRIEADGGEALLSEEPEREAGGEATFSLCLEGAARQFAARSALQPLSPGQPPFALLLCSDGLRKSCGSDADFLTLSRYLVGLPPAADQAGSPELAEALDHISRQGSGDDISVAVARWGLPRSGSAWPAPGRQEPARLVQPLPGPASGALQPAAETAAAGQVALTRAMASARDSTPQPPTPGAAPLASALAAPSLSPGAAPNVSSRRRGRSDAGRDPRRRGGRRSGRRLVLIAVGLALGGAGLLVAAGRAPGLFAARSQPPPLLLTPQQRSDLRRQVQALCDPPAGPSAGHTVAHDRAGASLAPGAPARPSQDPDRSGAPPAAPPSLSPADVALPSRQGSPTAVPGAAAPARDPRRQQRIAAILATRASVFQSLRQGDPAQAAALLAGSHADPLSALIAASASDASLRPAASPAVPPGPLQHLGRRLTDLSPWAEPSRQPPEAASPLAAPDACLELRQALRASWQRLEAAAAASPSSLPAPPAGPTVRSPATQGGRPGPAPALSGPPAGSAPSSR